jgi:hypothetical protein
MPRIDQVQMCRRADVGNPNVGLQNKGGEIKGVDLARACGVGRRAMSHMRCVFVVELTLQAAAFPRRRRQARVRALDKCLQVLALFAGAACPQNRPCARAAALPVQACQSSSRRGE